VSGRTDRRRRLTRGRRGGGDTLLAARDAGRVRRMPNLISSLIVFVGRGGRSLVRAFLSIFASVRCPCWQEQC
jgi:hypothetical protein